MHPVTPVGALAGREDELALLNGLFRDLALGSGNAALIEGEPGIGKTALARASLLSAGYGLPTRTAGHSNAPAVVFQAFWGTGDELGRELPLHPFLEALQVRMPAANARRTAIAGLLRGEVATDRGADVPKLLAEQLAALVVEEAAVRPVALVIDDLHWADPATIRLWGRLAVTARQAPLLLIGITRPIPQRDDLIELRHPIPDALCIRLGSLPPPAVAELVGTLAGGRPDTGLLKLAADAAGNPLYLTELLAALTRSGGISVSLSGDARLTASVVPESLPGAIADRLGFVSAPTREALRGATLLGVEFPVEDLAAVLGRPVTALVPAIDEARAAGVLADSGPGLAFRHPLIRDAMYAEIPASMRAAWHRDAGRALAAAGAAPDRVARQLLRALDAPGPGRPQPGQPAVELVELGRPSMGADRALASGAVDEWLMGWLTASADSLVGQAPAVAAELIGRALASIPAGSAEYGWLAGRQADALYRTGDRETAMRLAQQALAYATDPDLIVSLHWTLAQGRMLAGSGAESLATLERALSTDKLPAKHRALLLVLAARTYQVIGDLDSADREAERALGLAVGAGDAWATAWSLHVLAIGSTIRGDLTGALPLYARALAVTESDPTLADLGLLLLVNKAVTLGDLNRYKEAVSTGERACRLAGQVGTAMRLTQAHGVLGQLYFQTGRWDDALTEIEAVPMDLKEPGAACGELSTLAVISFHRNQPEVARRYLAAAAPHAERFGPRLISPLLRTKSLDRERAGKHSQALAVLTSAFDAEPDDLCEIEDLLADAVRLALKTGDKAAARALAERAADLAAGSVIPHRLGNALYCRGLVDQDPAVLLEAADRYGEASRPLPRAKALEAAAALLADGGDQAAARTALDQAISVYQSLGAEADLNRIQAEFRGRGIRLGPHSRHRTARSGWESLTDTELKVAAHIAEGLSNPDIAARLLLSPRTVSTHVSHILKKLKAATRADIARESALRIRA